MAHITADRVRDTTTTAGTSALTVSGTAPTAYRTFSAVCSIGDTFWYAIQHQTAAEWEVGLGTYSSANTVTRTTVLASSNSGSAVNFSAGTKDVFITLAATKTVQQDTAGRVGIGTSSPTEKLSVVGRAIISSTETNAAAKQGLFGVKHYTNAEEPFYGVHHYADSDSNTLYLGGGTVFGNAATSVYFVTAADNTTTGGTIRMRINSAGNVGIGTNSPTDKLNVSDGTVTFQLKPLGGSSIGFFGTRTNHALGLTTNDTERMRIDSAGNVGIGTSFAGGYTGTVNLGGSGSPTGGYLEGFMNGQTVPSSVASRFDGFISVPNTAAASFTLSELNHFRAQGGVFGSGSAVTSQIGFHAASSLTGATYNFGFLSDIASATGRWNFYAAGTADNYFAGNVGIGTSSPAYKLQLSTDSAAKPSTNTWTIASDGRLKNETGEYTKGLDAVCGLRPVTYTYNGKGGFTDTTTENISIIAQEAQVHFPECVGSIKGEIDGEETDILNWNGHALTFALVNAVKELKSKIETLEARVAQLEGN